MTARTHSPQLSTVIIDPKEILILTGHFYGMNFMLHCLDERTCSKGQYRPMMNCIKRGPNPSWVRGVIFFEDADQHDRDVS